MDDITLLLKNFLRVNGSSQTGNGSDSDCDFDLSGELDVPTTLRFGRQFYAYVTPIIIFVGLVGNFLSLNVFLSKVMRKQSASYYLAALSVSDISVLLIYVLLEWFRRGLPHLPGGYEVHIIDIEGVCQTFLYLSYVVRFLSVWLIVVFTIERYIGVCRPLKRREMCTRSFARRVIFGLITTGLLLFIFKPVISSVREVSPGGGLWVCAWRDGFQYTAFILDSTYAMIITLMPFLIISVLNFLIVRKLFIRNRVQRNVISQENILRIEFTFILLALSSCFIALNLPYFAVFCRQFYLSSFVTVHDTAYREELENIKGAILITKTIFYINYCINFFLYSITGGYFRREIRTMFNRKKWNRSSFSRTSRFSSNNTTPQQSWV